MKLAINGIPTKNGEVGDTCIISISLISIAFSKENGPSYYCRNCSGLSRTEFSCSNYISTMKTNHCAHAHIIRNTMNEATSSPRPMRKNKKASLVLDLG